MRKFKKHLPLLKLYLLPAVYSAPMPSQSGMDWVLQTAGTGFLAVIMASSCQEATLHALQMATFSLVLHRAFHQYAVTSLFLPFPLMISFKLR